MNASIDSKQEERAYIASLVRAARDGDREAFGELAVRYEGTVYAIAYRRLGNHAEAQELCQEVFVQALERLYQLKAVEAFGSWLKQIAVNMSINRGMRRDRSVSSDPEVMQAVCLDSRTPYAQALANERRQQVDAGLKRLGDLDRLTLEAFYLKGQSLLEMSDAFQSPVGTIKRRLHVARKRLAKQLEALAV